MGGRPEPMCDSIIVRIRRAILCRAIEFEHIHLGLGIAIPSSTAHPVGIGPADRVVIIDIRLPISRAGARTSNFAAVAGIGWSALMNIDRTQGYDVQIPTVLENGVF